MNITVVLHDATMTDVPRVGGLIAGALQKHESVRVIALRDGPLVPWLRDVISADHLDVVTDDAFSNTVPFAERMDKAAGLLQKNASDLVYVNSVAASVFVAAAKELGRHVVLHVHENSSELRYLLDIQATRPDIVGLADGIVVAADNIITDLAEVFPTRGERVLNFGIAADAEALRTLARQPALPPLNAGGQPWKRTGRFAVGMCGTASHAKGADIFMETAAQAADFDFIWIGAWRAPDAPDNPVREDFERRALPNLFITGATDNPYAHMEGLSIFFLSSRRDPYPLVLAEAAILGVPIVAFSGTTAMTQWLGRAAVLCYGTPNAADTVRVLRALEPEDMRSQEFNPLPGEITAEFDMDYKCDGLRQFIAGIRSGTALGTGT